MNVSRLQAFTVSTAPGSVAPSTKAPEWGGVPYRDDNNPPTPSSIFVRRAQVTSNEQHPDGPEQVLRRANFEPVIIGSRSPVPVPSPEPNRSWLRRIEESGQLLGLMHYPVTTVAGGIISASAAALDGRWEDASINALSGIPGVGLAGRIGGWVGKGARAARAARNIHDHGDTGVHAEQPRRPGGDPRTQRSERIEELQQSQPIKKNDALRRQAGELGYTERLNPNQAKSEGIQGTHGQQVFRNRKGEMISYDANSHGGGFWKKFRRDGTREGTYTRDLRTRIGD